MDLQAEFELGNQCYVEQNYTDAIEHYQNVLSVIPDQVDVLHNYALSLHQLGRDHEALALLSLPVEMGNVESCITRGAINRTLYNYEDAKNDFAKAFLLNPNNASACGNYGNTLREFGQPIEAIAFCKLAQHLNPHAPIFRLNESIAHLTAGNLLAGWEKYDGRWFYESETSLKPVLEGPEFNGTQDINGKIVFVYGEQGFGDCIQFSRYIRLLTERGAIVHLFVREPIARLIQHSFPDIVVTSTTNIKQYHFHVPILDLPKCFATTIDNIPPLNLSIDNSEVEKWNTRLDKHDKLRVGIVWSSTRAAWTTRFRNIDLCELLSIKNDNVELYNLEYDYIEHSEILVENNVKIVQDHISDFYDTGALISNLDLVITVDTAAAHLSGGLGVPTWVLLSDYAVDWRWFLDRTDSPFYPSVKLFRQQGKGWSTVLDSIRQELVRLTDK